jgi:hypothetical protein
MFVGSFGAAASALVAAAIGAHNRNRQRSRRAAMAGVAGDVAMAFEIISVEREHHSHHLAGHLLRLLIVLIEMVFDVAVTAFDVERSGDELHRGNHLAGRNSFEDLDIFVNLLGGFSGFARGRLRRSRIGSGLVIHSRFDFAGERVGFRGVTFFLVQAHQGAGRGQV